MPTGSRTGRYAPLMAFRRTNRCASVKLSCLPPPAELSTVVTQDEFTHDVVIQVSPEVFLVFDTT